MRLNPDCRILANLSGGIDSVYGIYRLLRDGQHPLIHHCHLGGNKRLPWETKATERVLHWFTTQGYTGWDFIESVVELPPYRYRTRMRDPDLIMMISGQILRDRPHIKWLDYYNNAEDTSTRYPRMRRRREHILQFWAGRPVQISRPLMDLTKAQIIKLMPAELFALASWCRFPDPHGLVCHKCIPCRKVDDALSGGGSAVQKPNSTPVDAFQASADGKEVGGGNADR